MENKQNKKQQQNMNSLTNQQGSGSQYHEQHAGNIEGYGELDPNGKGVNSTNNTNQ